MGGSGLGTHVHPWLIHVNVRQNQYSIVKQNKVKIKIKKNKALFLSLELNPQPGIKPTATGVKALSANHLATRELPLEVFI